MDELTRSKERLEKLRGELEAAESELQPLQASAHERADREVEELISFAKERGHSWVERKEDEEIARRMLGSTAYRSGFEKGGPHHKADQKVDRLKSQIRWWGRKVRKEEWEATKAQYLAEALAKRNREE